MIKKTILTATILFAVTILVPQVYAPFQDSPYQSSPLGAVKDKAVPDWIDQNFIWYAQKQISQTELVNSLEFLVKERIIVLPSTVQNVEAQEITQSLEETQQRLDKLEYQDAAKTEQIQQLGEQVKKAEIVQVESTPIPDGSPTTYVKYKKGAPENFKLTVLCDNGDVATGGGFLPSVSGEGNLGIHGSMPHPTNYATNPRMNNPIGWTYYSADPGEARVWVVCLDLTPSKLSAGTIP